MCVCVCWKAHNLHWAAYSNSHKGSALAYHLSFIIGICIWRRDQSKALSRICVSLCVCLCVCVQLSKGWRVLPNLISAWAFWHSELCSRQRQDSQLTNRRVKRVWTGCWQQQQQQQELVAGSGSSTINRTYLNCCILDWLIRIVHILQRYAIELTLVDVGDAIVFAPLRRADRALQIIAKAHICEAKQIYIYIK